MTPFCMQEGLVNCDAIVELLDASVVQGVLRQDVTGVEMDSRLVREGDVFVAVAGEQVDGDAFVEQAVQRGAVAIVSSRTDSFPIGEVLQIHVPQPRVAVAQLACALSGHPSRTLDVVGVTGTNGKTSTSFLLQAMLREAGRNPGLIGSIQHEVQTRRIPAVRTTPEAPVLQDLLRQMVRSGCDSAVMEVSSHALCQHRCTGVEYRVGIFTNLTPEHLDYHGSMESYFAAKCHLFDLVAASGRNAIAVVNLDDEWGRRLWRQLPVGLRRLGFGDHPDADLRAVDIRFTPDGVHCRLETPWGSVPLVSSLLGTVGVANILAACSAAGALGVTVVQMQAALRNMPQIPGRLERIAGRPGQPQVLVDYAHTADALWKVLETVRNVAAGRVIVVFGCGGDRDREKRPHMGRAAAELADVVVLTSDNPRTEDPAFILEEIRQGIGEGDVLVVEQLDRRIAIREAIEMAGEEDLVLIAGKGHETYQELASTIVPLDDREVAREVLDGTL